MVRSGFIESEIFWPPHLCYIERSQSKACSVARHVFGRFSLANQWLVKAQKDAMKSELSVLESQVKDYEKLRSGKYRVLKDSSFDDLPIELIRARIALGYTQKKLAERVGLKEQQIQRYEETEYSAASFSRLKEIIEALGLDVKEKILLSKEAVK